MKPHKKSNRFLLLNLAANAKLVMEQTHISMASLVWTLLLQVCDNWLD